MPDITNKNCILKAKDRSIDAKLTSIKQEDGQTYYRLTVPTPPEQSYIDKVFFICDMSKNMDANFRNTIYKNNRFFNTKLKSLKSILKKAITKWNQKITLITHAYKQANVVFNNENVDEQNLMKAACERNHNPKDENNACTLEAIKEFLKNLQIQDTNNSIITVVLSSGYTDASFIENQSEMEKTLEEISTFASQKNIKLNVILIGFIDGYDTQLFKTISKNLKISDNDKIIIANELDARKENSNQITDIINRTDNFVLKVDGNLVQGRQNQQSKEIDMYFTCKDIDQVFKNNAIEINNEKEIELPEISEEEANKITQLALENEMPVEYASLYSNLMSGGISYERSLGILLRFTKYALNEKTKVIVQEKNNLMSKIIHMVDIIEKKQPPNKFNIQESKIEEIPINLFLINTNDANLLEQVRKGSLKMIDDIFATKNKKEIVEKLGKIKEINKTSIVDYLIDISQLPDFEIVKAKTPLRQIQRLNSHKQQYDELVQKLLSKEYYICRKLADWLREKSDIEYKQQKEQLIPSVITSIKAASTNVKLASWLPIVQSLANEEITKVFYAKQIDLNNAKYKQMKYYIDPNKTIFVDFEKARLAVRSTMLELTQCIIPFANTDSIKFESSFNKSKKIMLNEINQIKQIIDIKTQDESYINSGNNNLENLSKELEKLKAQLSNNADVEIMQDIKNCMLSIKYKASDAQPPGKISAEDDFYMQYTEEICKKYEEVLEESWEFAKIAMQKRNKCFKEIKTKFRAEINKNIDAINNADTLKKFLSTFVDENSIDSIIETFAKRQELNQKFNLDLKKQDILESIIFVDDCGYINKQISQELINVPEILQDDFNHGDIYSYKETELLKLKAIIMGTIAIIKFYYKYDENFNIVEVKEKLDEHVKKAIELKLDTNLYAEYLQQTYSEYTEGNRTQFTQFFNKLISELSASKEHNEMLFWNGPICLLEKNEVQTTLRNKMPDYGFFACAPTQQINSEHWKMQISFEQLINCIDDKYQPYINSISQNDAKFGQFPIIDFISLLELMKKVGDYNNLSQLLKKIKNEQCFASIDTENEICLDYINANEDILTLDVNKNVKIAILSLTSSYHFFTITEEQLAELGVNKENFIKQLVSQNAAYSEDAETKTMHISIFSDKDLIEAMNDIFTNQMQKPSDCCLSQEMLPRRQILPDAPLLKNIANCLNKTFEAQLNLDKFEGIDRLNYWINFLKSCIKIVRFMNQNNGKNVCSELAKISLKVADHIVNIQALSQFLPQNPQTRVINNDISYTLPGILYLRMSQSKEMMCNSQANHMIVGKNNPDALKQQQYLNFMTSLKLDYLLLYQSMQSEILGLFSTLQECENLDTQYIKENEELSTDLFSFMKFVHKSLLNEQYKYQEIPEEKMIDHLSAELDIIFGTLDAQSGIELRGEILRLLNERKNFLTKMIESPILKNQIAYLNQLLQVDLIEKTINTVDNVFDIDQKQKTTLQKISPKLIEKLEETAKASGYHGLYINPKIDTKNSAQNQELSQSGNLKLNQNINDDAQKLLQKSQPENNLNLNQNNANSATIAKKPEFNCKEMILCYGATINAKSTKEKMFKAFLDLTILGYFIRIFLVIKKYMTNTAKNATQTKKQAEEFNKPVLKYQEEEENDGLLNTISYKDKSNTNQSGDNNIPTKKQKTNNL